MYSYSTSPEDMLRYANVVKDTLLDGLEKEGLLIKPAVEIGERYALVVHQKGWLGQLWEKFFEGVDKASFRVTLVKRVS